MDFLSHVHRCVFRVDVSISYCGLEQYVIGNNESPYLHWINRYEISAFGRSQIRRSERDI